MGVRWRDIALVVSVAANIFILGAVVGGKAAGLRVVGPWAAERGEIGRLGAREIDPRAYIAALPREQRRETMRRVMTERSDVRPLFREAHEARRAVGELMEAETFDPDALRAALDRVRAADAVLQARGHDFLIRLMEETPPEIRREALETARRHPRRRGDFHFRDHRGDDDMPMRGPAPFDEPVPGDQP